MFFMQILHRLYSPRNYGKGAISRLCGVADWQSGSSGGGAGGRQLLLQSQALVLPSPVNIDIFGCLEMDIVYATSLPPRMV